MWNLVIPALAVAVNFLPNLLFRGFYPEAVACVDRYDYVDAGE